MKIVVGIATAGRRETLSNALRQLALQTRPPDLLVICPAKPVDCDEEVLGLLPFPTRVVRGLTGLTNQRNAILEVCSDCDVIVFFDDDYYADTRYLGEVERIFERSPDVVGITGLPPLDGNLTPGIPHTEALSMLAKLARQRVPEGEQEIYNLYGCNMAMRLAPVRRDNMTFDPRLPLYSWLEDVDFSRRIATHGRLLRLERLLGVHLAEKRGRTSGVRFGYSQVANPLYLMRKGTMSPRHALAQTGRNMARNFQRYAFPEEWVDRRGRVRGNLMAIADLLRWRMRPENILELG